MTSARNDACTIYGPLIRIMSKIWLQKSQNIDLSKKGKTASLQDALHCTWIPEKNKDELFSLSQGKWGIHASKGIRSGWFET